MYNFKKIQSDSKIRIVTICKSINHLFDTCNINSLGYFTNDNEIAALKILIDLLNSELRLSYYEKTEHDVMELRNFIIERYFSNIREYLITYDTVFFVFKNRGI